MYLPEYSDLDQLFTEARQHLLASSWINIDKAVQWETVLPPPPPLPPPAFLMVLGGPNGLDQFNAGERYKYAYWMSKAKPVFDEYKTEIALQKQEVEILVSSRIKVLSDPYKPLLSVGESVKSWLATQAELSLKAFIRLNIKSEMIDDYITPLVLEHRKRYELGDPATDQQPAPALTDREKILIHCYKQLPAIGPKEKGYQDYMTYARPGDRISHSGDSKRTAKALIRSIEKIFPYLNETERKQAQGEIHTIEAKFRNQL